MFDKRRIAKAMAVFALALAVGCGGPVTEAHADPLVEQLVAERAATLASISRRYEEDEQAALARIAARAREIGAALRAGELAASERRRLEAEIAALAAECDVLTQRLGASYPEFGADLAAYRQAVTSMAHSRDPRRVAALQRYADGDRVAALETLASIQEAETRAVAAGWREIGALALDMRDRGEATTSRVSEVFQQAQRLDPSDGEATRQLVALLMEEHRYPEALAAIEAHQGAGLTGRPRAEALLMQGRLFFQIAESRRAQPILREAIAAYDTLRQQSPNDLTLLLRWVDANNLLRFTISSGGGATDQEQARRQERNDISLRIARALAAAPAYNTINDPGTLYELTRLNCSLYGALDAATDFAAGLRARCLAGVGALQARFPNTYFAQRAELASMITRYAAAEPGNQVQNMGQEMPAIISLTRRLYERDPDSVLLISTLGVQIQFLFVGEMAANQGRPSPNSPALTAMRDVVSLYESAFERGRLTPRDEVTMLTHYVFLHQLGVRPASGPSYGQRGRAVLDRLKTEMSPTSDMWRTLQAFERSLPPAR